ncbi:LuxR C-terminal-related transcriptional regulator [Streptomyces sp. NBC_00237]|uniref:LuxR C-terminal-related transcriptional regulator n=1 Tax=Streptomyces sp. NBC_00237 TaxID=2975687 RepID=UPI00224E460A|nr:LuxR C-terminal-related transcriptional regulator [Streptomyces sp. NBC_00237]MCX5205043.1 LuxR C-terminal-related transcriptional regulator [Streptomyces sp. NBC_00237]
MLHIWEVGDATDAVYREMIRCPGIDVAGLCARLGLPETDVRSSLDRLADSALIRASWDTADQAPPAHPVHSADPVHPAPPAHPVHSADPVHPAPPAHPVHPADPVHPAHPVHPADPVRPAHPVRPADAMQPVSPRLGFQALLARKQAEIAVQQQALEETRLKMSSLIDDYVAEYTEARGTGLERLHGLSAVRMRLEELAARTEYESLSFAPGGPQTPDNRSSSTPLLRELLARSVSVKTVYLDSIRNDPDTVRHARWLDDNGGEIRTVPHLPFRMQIVDRKAALVPLHLEESAQGALLIEEPSVVSILCALFDMVWTAAAALSSDAGVTEGVSPQERELLRLLAQGLTDEAVARKLGVSLRTERRMLTRVSEHLNAQSRFQLGQRAVEAGLL